MIRVQKKAAKEKNGKLVNQRTTVEYQDTAETNIMRSNLQLINSCLEKHWVDLEFDDESIEQIQKEMLSKKAESLIVDRNLNFTNAASIVYSTTPNSQPVVVFMVVGGRKFLVVIGSG